MELLLHFHVKSANRNKLVEILQAYSGIDPIVTDRSTDDLLDNILCDIHSTPNYYVVSHSRGEWQSVEVNSFKKLYELGNELSTRLNAVFLQTLYSSSCEYVYFLLMDAGKIIREIENIGGSQTPRIDNGNPLEFEDKEKLRDFDLDSIAHYCLQFGIDISNLFCEEMSVVFQQQVKGAVIGHGEKEKLFQLLMQREK